MDKLEEEKKTRETAREKKNQKQEQQHTIADTNDCLCLFFENVRMKSNTLLHCSEAIRQIKTSSQS